MVLPLKPIRQLGFGRPAFRFEVVVVRYDGYRVHHFLLHFLTEMPMKEEVIWTETK